MNEPRKSKAILTNDLNDSIQKISYQHRSPLFQRVLNVYTNRQSRNDKSQEFLNNLSCFLAVGSRPECDIDRKIFKQSKQTRPSAILLEPCNATEGYAAVSYSWNPCKGESNSKRGYQLLPNYTHVSVRATVLDRVIRFIKYKQGERKIIPFWIDRLSIEQKNGRVKDDALQAMDIVYKNCEFAIGCLRVEITNQSHLDCLSRLMQGRIVTVNPGDRRLTLQAGVIDHMKSLPEVLSMITGDRWWSRAWIFHEDYLAGPKMWLLIRHAPFLKKAPGCSELGSLPNELVINSADFKYYATLFCLAYIRTQDDTLTKYLCQKILEKIKRYNTLHVQDLDEYMISSEKNITISILEDLKRRRISIKSDLLAITANVCGYGTRFTTMEKRAVERSLSLSILALCLCNGEILASGKAENEVNETIVGFLQQKALIIECPMGDKGLTFIKHCRLQVDQLSPNGIYTRGTLWKLSEVIRPDRFQMKANLNCQRSNQSDLYNHGLDSYHQQRLCDIVNMLYHRRHRTLARLLENFLHKSSFPANRHDEWSSDFCMDIMASSLVHAIQGRKYLQLAYPINVHAAADEAKAYRAIFVRDLQDIQNSGPKFAFTSWSCTMQDTRDEQQCKNLATYASLEVEIDENTRDGLPLLRTKAWMNGLSFFPGLSRSPVVFAWPDSLLQ